ncbi:murein biosynthesis integral membrane protein MurJ [soil metagenome]
MFKALATVSSLTLVSRITGLVRDTMTLRLFGASAATDAFVFAFTLPNLLRRLFAEGAFSQAFVPILGEIRTRQGDEAARELIDNVAIVLAATLALVTLIGIVAAPVIVMVAAPGFAADRSQTALASLMLRIMFPYLGFISMVALAGGVLNTWGRFAIPAITPVLLNISMIVAMWLGAGWFDPPELSLAIGVFAGGVAQLVLQVPALIRAGVVPRVRHGLRAAWNHPGVRRVLNQMGPAVLGVSVAQVSLVINRVFQSFLESGSMTWLYSADRLMEFPTALLGVALGTVLTPSLSRASASGDKQAYGALLDWGLRLACVLALPAAIGMAVLSVPLVATLFHHGRFDAQDVEMSARAVSAYSAGLLGLILIKILAPGFYANRDIKTPVRIGLATLVLTQCLNLVLIGPLKHVGLALAISIAASVNAALLYVILRRRGIYLPQPGWRSFALRLLPCLALLAAALWIGTGRFDWIALGAGPWWQRVGALALVGGIGIGLYFVALLMLGFRVGDFRHRQT